MCGNCHGKARWFLRAFKYILDVMWQRLLYMLHDVSSSPSCLLAMINVAHHCDQAIPGWLPLNFSHGAHMQIYIESMSHVTFLYLLWLEVNFQLGSYCHFQVFVCMRRASFFPRPELSRKVCVCVSKKQKARANYRIIYRVPLIHPE
jgi:hypothetical protein